MSKEETDTFICKSLEKTEDGNNIYHLNSKERTRFQLNVGAIETLVEEENQSVIKVRGVASSTSVDHYGTEMSFKALMKMKEQVKRGVVILPRHDSLTGSGLAEWDEVIGRTTDAEVKQAKVINPSRLNTPQFVLEVDSYLYADDQRTTDLIKRLKRGEPIGQSIGGWFENIKVEETEDGEIKRVIVEDVTLDHIAITRAPANPDSGGLSLNIRSSIKSYLLDRRNTMPKRTKIKSNEKVEETQSEVIYTETNNVEEEIDTRAAELDESAVEVQPTSQEIEPSGDADVDDKDLPFDPVVEVERMKKEMEEMKKEVDRMKLMKQKAEMMKEMERVKAEFEDLKRQLEEERVMYEKTMHGDDKKERVMYEKGMEEKGMEEKAMEEKAMEEMAEVERVMKEKAELMKEIERMKKEMAEKMKDQRAVVPFNSNLPLAPETLSWDWNTESQNEILGDNGDNWEVYKRAHLYFDENADMETKSAYKLPIAKIVDGELKVVFRALVAAVGALNGARGGVNIPENERSKIYENIQKYYAKFNKEVPELVNRSKELQETEATLDNKQNLSNSSNNTNLHRSEDMNKEDMNSIIAEVTKSVLEAMQQEQRSVTEANTVETRSVSGNEIIDIAHGTKEPTIEELKARLEQAENTLSRVLDQPLRKGRHTSTNVRGIGAEVEMDHLIEASSNEGNHSLSTVMRRNKEILMRSADTLSSTKVSNHQLKDILKQGLRAAYLDGLIGTPVDGWQ